MPTPHQEPAADPRSGSENAITPDQVEARLATLRQQAPAAVVQIDAVRVDDTVVAIKATIALPGGARHSYIAARDVDTSHSAAVQIAEVQALAIAHALDGLGLTATRPGAPAESRTGQNAPSAATPSPKPSPVTPAPEADNAGNDGNGTDHLPEYSWNAFWQAARARGVTRDQVERALGRSVQDATPRDAVEALQTAGLWG